VRASLVAALASCADSSMKTPARRFLAGLSSDELQFIAGFLGACALESAKERCVSRAQVADRIAGYLKARTSPDERSADQEHKMILLLEYLCHCGLLHFSLPALAGQPS
jgi:hypothetical protein